MYHFSGNQQHNVEFLLEGDVKYSVGSISGVGATDKIPALDPGL